MAQGLKTVARALALRLRYLSRMLDRLDRLEAGSGEWLAGLEKGELEAAAREMTLRALRAASDPANFRILAFVAERATCPMATLEAFSKLDRFSLNERVSDLIQVALMSREIDTDVVQIGEAGVALVQLFSDMYQETARQLDEYLAPVTRLD